MVNEEEELHLAEESMVNEEEELLLAEESMVNEEEEVLLAKESMLNEEEILLAGKIKLRMVMCRVCLAGAVCTGLGLSFFGNAEYPLAIEPFNVLLGFLVGMSAMAFDSTAPLRWKLRLLQAPPPPDSKPLAAPAT